MCAWIPTRPEKIGNVCFWLIVTRLGRKIHSGLRNTRNMMQVNMAVVHREVHHQPHPTVGVPHIPRRGHGANAGQLPGVPIVGNIRNKTSQAYCCQPGLNF